MHAVDSHGETALIFIEGIYSHAMRKGPLLVRGEEAQAPGTYREQMAARQPSKAELDAAEAVLSRIPSSQPLLYARIDLVPGEDGRPILIEAELTEPALFLTYSDGAADTLARAIQRRCG